jgi:tripartite-type tricarboxylate transporter receptor subunit TctC
MLAGVTMLKPYLRAFPLAALIAFLSGAPCAAQDFYRGKTIRLIVGASAIGGYNLNARTVARYMPRHIPGNPNIVVVNMPAGTGIAAINHLYNVADKDGATFGLFNRYTVLAPIFGAEQAKFKPEGFNWLGTTADYSDNAYLFIIRADLPATDIESVRRANPALNVGLMGAAPIQVINEALGLNLRLISGYTSDNLEIAFENGELDGHTIGYQTLLSRKPDWLEKKIARPIIQFGRISRHPDLPNVPTARELAATSEQRSMIEFVEAPLMIGYPFALPPGVPAERVAVMRRAFQDTMNDPEFQAEIKRQGLELAPRDGEAIAETIRQLSRAPESVIQRYKALVGHRSPG